MLGHTWRFCPKEVPFSSLQHTKEELKLLFYYNKGSPKCTVCKFIKGGKLLQKLNNVKHTKASKAALSN